MNRSEEGDREVSGRQGLKTHWREEGGERRSLTLRIGVSIRRQIPGFAIGLIVGAALVAWWEDVSGKRQPEELVASPADHVVAPTEFKRSPGDRQTSIESEIDSLDVTAPMLREAELTQLGYALAGRELESAMRRIDTLNLRSEKVAMLRGIFTRVAQDKPPFEAIKRVKRLQRDLEPEGFRTLISEWTGEAMPEGVVFGDCYVRLLQAEDVSSDIKEAWMKAYKDHPQRSNMLANWAGRIAQDSSEDAEALGSHLSGWEHEEFLRTLARIRITDGRIDEVWEWIDQNREEIGNEGLAAVFENWHSTDYEGVLKAFDSLTDPQERLVAAAAIGKRQASMLEDTQAALAWADSLPTQAEQDAAHEAIYKATPRGIGAQLTLDEGVVTIRGLIDGTPAAESGLRSGDRIVGVDPGDGSFAPIGNTLHPAVDLIRGEAGTDLRIRVLRSGGETEVIELKRQQLIFGQ
ncbi:PDZ domain-containing protein [Verrucomicrobiales bacterium]|nr:PDZ domain-containing protein [Verrucomicrobiales bacterium]MDA7666390.1 PDZ domain-containing protein [bacterium]